MEPELVFEALYDGNTEVVKRAAASFDWRASCDTWGSPLLAIIAGKCFDLDASRALFDAKLELAQWCIAHGSEPEQHAPASCIWKVWIGPCFFSLHGNSALSLVCNFREELVTFREDCTEEEDDLRGPLTDALTRLDLFFKALTSSERGPPKVCILEGVANLWERIYQDEVSADVVFACRKSSREQQQQQQQQPGGSQRNLRRRFPDSWPMLLPTRVWT
mmetsp:Transcript_12319/g.22157  ORF Transcript_12319/g.22157 Transcript_12319/m.22157 type:complete len:219 (+) Transcript_12319:62-718(+)